MNDSRGDDAIGNQMVQPGNNQQPQPPSLRTIVPRNVPQQQPNVQLLATPQTVHLIQGPVLVPGGQALHMVNAVQAVPYGGIRIGNGHYAVQPNARVLQMQPAQAINFARNQPIQLTNMNQFQRAPMQMRQVPPVHHPQMVQNVPRTMAPAQVQRVQQIVDLAQDRPTSGTASKPPPVEDNVITIDSTPSPDENQMEDDQADMPVLDREGAASTPQGSVDSEQSDDVVNYHRGVFLTETSTFNKNSDGYITHRLSGGLLIYESDRPFATRDYHEDEIEDDQETIEIGSSIDSNSVQGRRGHPRGRGRENTAAERAGPSEPPSEERGRRKKKEKPEETPPQKTSPDGPVRRRKKNTEAQRLRQMDFGPKAGAIFNAESKRRSGNKAAASQELEQPPIRRARRSRHSPDSDYKGEVRRESSEESEVEDEEMTEQSDYEPPKEVLKEPKTKKATSTSEPEICLYCGGPIRKKHWHRPQFCSTDCRNESLKLQAKDAKKKKSDSSASGTPAQSEGRPETPMEMSGEEMDESSMPQPVEFVAQSTMSIPTGEPNEARAKTSKDKGEGATASKLQVPSYSRLKAPSDTYTPAELPGCSKKIGKVEENKEPSPAQEKPAQIKQKSPPTAIPQPSEPSKAVRQPAEPQKQIRQTTDSPKAVRQAPEAAKGIPQTSEPAKTVQHHPEFSKTIQQPKATPQPTEAPKAVQPKIVPQSFGTPTTVRQAPEAPKGLPQTSEPAKTVQHHPESSKAIQQSKATSQPTEAPKAVQQPKIVPQSSGTPATVRQAPDVPKAIPQTSEPAKTAQHHHEPAKSIQQPKTTPQPTEAPKAVHQPKIVPQSSGTPTTVRQPSEPQMQVRQSTDSARALCQPTEPRKIVQQPSETPKAVQQPPESSKPIPRTSEAPKAVHQPKTIPQPPEAPKAAYVHQSSEPPKTVRQPPEPQMPVRQSTNSPKAVHQILEAPKAIPQTSEPAKTVQHHPESSNAVHQPKTIPQPPEAPKAVSQVPASSKAVQQPPESLKAGSQTSESPATLRQPSEPQPGQSSVPPKPLPCPFSETAHVKTEPKQESTSPSPLAESLAHTPTEHFPEVWSLEDTRRYVAEIDSSLAELVVKYELTGYVLVYGESMDLELLRKKVFRLENGNRVPFGPWKKLISRMEAFRQEAAARNAPRRFLRLFKNDQLESNELILENVACATNQKTVDIMLNYGITDAAIWMPTVGELVRYTGMSYGSAMKLTSMLGFNAKANTLKSMAGQAVKQAFMDGRRETDPDLFLRTICGGPGPVLDTLIKHGVNRNRNLVFHMTIEDLLRLGVPFCEAARVVGSAREAIKADCPYVKWDSLSLPKEWNITSLADPQYFFNWVRTFLLEEDVKSLTAACATPELLMAASPFEIMGAGISFASAKFLWIKLDTLRKISPTAITELKFDPPERLMNDRWRTMTPSDVAEWIAELGDLPEVSEKFLARGIDGRTLPYLTLPTLLNFKIRFDIAKKMMLHLQAADLPRDLVVPDGFERLEEEDMKKWILSVADEDTWEKLQAAQVLPKYLDVLIGRDLNRMHISVGHIVKIVELLRNRKWDQSHVIIPAGNPRAWDVDAVATWVGSITTEKLAEKFKENCLDGQNMAELKFHEYEEELGIPTWPAKVIYTKFSKLQSRPMP